MNCMRKYKNIHDYTDYICEKTLEDYDCCICLNGIEKGQTIKLLKCNHIYHKSCIESWFKKKKACPYCNIKIKIKK